MALKLKPNDSIATINEFLAQVCIPNFHIHPKLVEFNDIKDRQRKITFFHNKLIAKGLPKDIAQSQSEELINTNTLSVSIKSLTQKGLVLILVGLEAMHFPGGRDWLPGIVSSRQLSQDRPACLGVLFFSLFLVIYTVLGNVAEVHHHPLPGVHATHGVCTWINFGPISLEPSRVDEDRLRAGAGPLPSLSRKLPHPSRPCRPVCPGVDAADFDPQTAGFGDGDAVSAGALGSCILVNFVRLSLLL